MTTQQAYERMRIYLTRPGARQASDAETGDCYYEKMFEDGEIHRCAVGCLLSPQTLRMRGRERYQGILLKNYGGSAYGLRDEYAVPEFSVINWEFLNDAQAVHDKPENWAKGKFDVAKLDAVAKKHGLTVVSDEQKVTKGAPRELVPA